MPWSHAQVARQTLCEAVASSSKAAAGLQSTEASQAFQRALRQTLQVRPYLRWHHGISVADAFLYSHAAFSTNMLQNGLCKCASVQLLCSITSNWTDTVARSWTSSPVVHLSGDSTHPDSHLKSR